MSIQDLIIQKHLRDQDQLDVIFSRDKSIVVTAPAGCGKTTTMISGDENPRVVEDPSSKLGK